MHLTRQTGRLYLISLAWWLLVLAGCESKTALEHLAAAQEAAAGGSYRVAIIEAKNAVQKAPQLGEARVILGELDYRSGNYGSALNQLERALDLDAETPRSKLLRLRSKVRLGRYSETIGELEAEPGALEPQFAVVLADAYLAGGDTEKAKPLAETGAHLPEGMFTLANLALVNGDTQRSLDYLTEATRLDPAHRDGWTLKGEVELSLEQYAAALKSFEHAESLPAGEVGGQMGMARVHLAQDNLPAAIEIIDGLIARAPDFAPAQYLRGLIYVRQDDMTKAEQALRVVQQHAPDHLPTMYLMGLVKFRQGQLNQAEQNLRRYLDRDPGNVSVRKLLATVAGQRDDMSAVIDLLGPVVTHQDDPQVWAMLGSAYMKTNNRAAASEAFQKAVEIAPDMAPFRNQLALSLLSSGREEAALSELSTAVELDGEQVHSDYLRVMLYLRNGDYESADRVTNELIRKSPDDPIGLNLAGAVALAQEDTPRAKSHFEKALAADAAYFPAARNLGRLAESQGDLEEAERIYRRAVEKDSTSEAASLELIDVLSKRGMLAEAREIADTTVEHHHGSLSARLAQVRLALALRDLPAAVAHASSLIEVAGEVPDALILKAEVDFAAGNDGEARKTIARLQSILPRFKDNAALHAATGVLQLRTEEFTLARNNLEKALAMEASHPGALVAMAQLDLIEGNLKGSAARLAELDAAGISNEQIEVLRGGLRMAHNDVPGALKVFEDLSDQGSRIGHIRFALLASGAGANDRASSKLNNWLAAHPNDHGVRLVLANVQLQMGRSDLAKAQYESMMPIDNPVALNNLAWIYMQEGDARALNIANRAYELAPDSPDIADTLGWILVTNGDLEKGVEILRASARAKPGDPSIQYHLGVAYHRLGDASNARDALSRALAAGTPIAEQAEARRLLESLK